MSSINSLGGSNSMIYASMSKPKGRPDPGQMAEDLFAKLDTQGQGYIDKNTLENALGSMSSTDSNTASVDDIFGALDSDGDSKITKDEMSAGIKKLAEGLQSQVDQMRFGGAGQAGGMPPPPPPGDDAGMSKDQLTQMASDASAAGNTQAASDFSALAASFDKADTDKDGKVSFQEAQAYKQSTENTSASTSSTESSSSASESNNEAKIMHRLMQLLHSYGAIAGNGEGDTNNSISIAA